MAEPPPAPPSKRGPASKSVAPGSTLRSSKATHDRDLEKSKKKVNRKLAMEEIDQKKAIGNSEIAEEIDQKKVIGKSENAEEQKVFSKEVIEDQTNRESDCPMNGSINSESSQLRSSDMMAQQFQQDPPMDQTGMADDLVEHSEDNTQNIDPIENHEPGKKDTKMENIEDAKVEKQELVDLKPALELIAEMSGLKTKMRSDEYAVMSEEILDFARKIAKEQSENQNKNEALRSGIRMITERYMKETKLNKEKDLLEEMKGLCEVYARVKGGLNSKEETDEVMLRIIREMKSNGMRELKGKMKQEEQDDTLQAKGNQRTAGPGPSMDRGRNQNKDNMEGKQSRNPSKNRNGGQSPQKEQAFNKGPAGGSQMNWRNDKKNHVPQRKGVGTPGRQTGLSGNAGTFVRGEGSYRYQNYEKGGGNSRGGGRGYQGRGGWGGNSGGGGQAGSEQIWSLRVSLISLISLMWAMVRLQMVFGAGAEDINNGCRNRWADDCPKTMDMRLNGCWLMKGEEGSSSVLQSLQAVWADECSSGGMGMRLVADGGLRIVYHDRHEANGVWFMAAYGGVCFGLRIVHLEQMSMRLLALFMQQQVRRGTWHSTYLEVGVPHFGSEWFCKEVWVGRGVMKPESKRDFKVPPENHKEEIAKETKKENEKEDHTGNKMENNTQSKIESQREIQDESERKEVENPKTNAKTENRPEAVCEKAQHSSMARKRQQASLMTSSSSSSTLTFAVGRVRMSGGGDMGHGAKMVVLLQCGDPHKAIHLVALGWVLLPLLVAAIGLVGNNAELCTTRLAMKLRGRGIGGVGCFGCGALIRASFLLRVRE
nr:hypothetical protein Iba_chr12eCG17070 [Ipomoea batatas]